MAVMALVTMTYGPAVEGDKMHSGECEALDSGIYLTFKGLQSSVEFGARTAGLTRTGMNWSVHHYIPK